MEMLEQSSAQRLLREQDGMLSSLSAHAALVLTVLPRFSLNAPTGRCQAERADTLLMGHSFCKGLQVCPLTGKLLL